MISFLFVAAVMLIIALLAFRMIPAYIEYEYDGPNGSIAEVRNCLGYARHALA